MPGNLLVAAPTLVMPFTLCTAFTEARLFEVLVNTYHDGTPERGLIQDGVDVPVSMRRWTMSKRLPASTLIALRSFYESLNGGVDPFYWYNPQEAAPGYPVGSNYDPTGVNIFGRHTVVFTNQSWTETIDIARAVTSLALLEVD